VWATSYDDDAVLRGLHVPEEGRTLRARRRVIYILSHQSTSPKMRCCQKCLRSFVLARLAGNALSPLSLLCRPPLFLRQSNAPCCKEEKQKLAAMSHTTTFCSSLQIVGHRVDSQHHEHLEVSQSSACMELVPPLERQRNLGWRYIPSMVCLYARILRWKETVLIC
jgi:hypothetical protein